MKKPVYRFRTDDGSEFPEWKSILFNTSMKYLKNNSFSRDKLSPNGTVKNIHYGDILIKYGFLLDVKNTDIPYITDMDEIGDDTDKENTLRLQNGDIIFADTAEDYTAGKATEVSNINSCIVSGLHTIPCRPQIDFASGYLGLYFNSNLFKKQIYPWITGIKVLSISKYWLSKSIIEYPSIQEQKKIASLFFALDKKISLLTDLVENLKQAKKGYMQKIFSRKFRFKADDGSDYPEWEEKKIGDCVQLSKGGGLSKNDITENGETKCILYGELYTKYGPIIDKIYSSTNKTHDKLIFSEENDVVLPLSGETPEDISTASCIKEKGVALGGDLLVLRSNVLMGEFLSYLLNVPLKYSIAKIAQGKTVVHINIKGLKSIRVYIPNINEQQKIASFLSAWDKKINIAQQKLELAKDFKKGLMQKLFV